MPKTSRLKTLSKVTGMHEISTALCIIFLHGKMYRASTDLTQCSAIIFQGFANGVKVSNRNSPSEIYSEFISLKALISVFLSVLCERKTIA